MSTEPTPPATEPRLSVAMIVRDEAAHILAALNSVQAVADEIVVVDTGSRDETVALATQAGARVLHADWTDDFAAARNVGLEACTGQWVFVLDADEALSSDSIERLRAIVTTTPVEPTAFEVVVRNWTAPAVGTGFDHRGVRLFSRHPQVRYSGRIHEQLRHTTEGAAGIRWHLEPGIHIEHWGYMPEARQAKAKPERNLRLLEQTVAEHPDDPMSHHHLGMWYWAERSPAEALPAFERALQLAAELPEPPAYLTITHILRVASHVVLDQPAEALAAAEAAAPLCEAEPDYWFNVGLAQQGLGDHTAAIASFCRCLALKDTHPTMAEHGTRGWKAQLAMAQSLEALDDRTNAMAARWEALRDFPFQAVLHGRLWAQACLDDDAEARGEALGLWQSLPPDLQAEVADTCIQTLQQHDEGPLTIRVARDFVITLPLTHCGGAITQFAALLNRQRALGSGSALRIPQAEGTSVGRRLADFLAEQGDWPAFERVCRHAMAANIDVAAVAGSLGTVLMQAGDDAGAEAALRTAAEHDTADADVWNNLGVLAMRRQAMDEAEARFRKAIELKPDHFSANLNLVRTAWWFKQPDQGTLRLGAVMTALERMVQAPAGDRLESAVQELDAVHSYFRNWDMRRRQDSRIESPPGTDVFLQTLYVCWQLLGARLTALQHQRR